MQVQNGFSFVKRLEKTIGNPQRSYASLGCQKATLSAQETIISMEKSVKILPSALMKEVKYLIVVGGLVERGGKILLIQEKKPVAYGLWNTPAGWLDLGETPAEGAKREVKEETGFDVKINGLLGVYIMPSLHDQKLLIAKIVFICSITGGKMKFPKDEILDVKWFAPEEVLAMKDSQLR